MKAGVAAGHPATAAAGVEILAEGGSAADAAVAAGLASCVAETVMTGLLGGGHAIYLDAHTGVTRNLDSFCTAPGLGEPRREAELVHLDAGGGRRRVPCGDAGRGHRSARGSATQPMRANPGWGKSSRWLISRPPA